MKLLDWISLDKIDWNDLSKNPNAITIFDDFNFDNLNSKGLLKYLIKIKYVIKDDNIYKANFKSYYYKTVIKDFVGFTNIEDIPGLKGHFLNNIFEVDYKFLKDRMDSTIGEELMKVMFHPKNINKFQDWGY
jgi:hypothetical protein